METNAEKHLKICHVITRMIVGGAQENTLFTVVDHLKKGHEVVLVTGPSPGPEGKLLQQGDLPDFEIIEVPDLIREVNPLRDWKAFRALKKLFRERGFDVVHTHSSKAGVVGRAAARAAGVPVVVHTVHGQAFHRYEKPWKNLLYKRAETFAAKRCDRIFAVAQAMIDQCVDAHVAPREKYQVVYSGMDIGKFLSAVREDALRAELGIPREAKVVGAVARLFPLKGYEYFLPAAFEVARRNESVHFLIVGNGILLDELRAKIAAANLTERFHFAGLVPPDQVYRYIAQMDLLWHLSLREGLPRSVVQALAGGVPALGFRLDGTPEVLLDGQTGFCVEPGDERAVVEHSVALLSDDAARRTMGEAGRRLVAEKFDHRYMADVLEKAYLELYAAKRS